MSEETKDNVLYRYMTHGEGVWSAGKRLLPPELVDEANKNRAWLTKPALPLGEYRFYMTNKGKEKYEDTLYKTHQKYLPDITLEGIPREKIGEVVYEDEFQVVAKAKI